MSRLWRAPACPSSHRTSDCDWNYRGRGPAGRGRTGRPAVPGGLRQRQNRGRRRRLCGPDVSQHQRPLPAPVVILYSALLSSEPPTSPKAYSRACRRTVPVVAGPQLSVMNGSEILLDVEDIVKTAVLPARPRPHRDIVVVWVRPGRRILASRQHCWAGLSGAIYGQSLRGPYSRPDRAAYCACSGGPVAEITL